MLPLSTLQALLASYKERLSQGESGEKVDAEFRRWPFHHSHDDWRVTRISSRRDPLCPDGVWPPSLFQQTTIGQVHSTSHA